MANWRFCSKHADCGVLYCDQNKEDVHLGSFLWSEAQLSALTFNPLMMPSHFCLFTYLCFYFCSKFSVVFQPQNYLSSFSTQTKSILNYEEKKMLSCTNSYHLHYFYYPFFFSVLRIYSKGWHLSLLPISLSYLLFLYFLIVFRFTPLWLLCLSLSCVFSSFLPLSLFFLILFFMPITLLSE